MAIRKLAGLLVVSCLVAFPALPAAAQSMEPDEAVQAQVRALLEQAETPNELTAFVGHEADRCVPSPPVGRLCVWKLDRRSRGWRALARALGTNDRINLVCELQLEPTGIRSEESCSAHVQRSNREVLRLPSRSGPRGRNQGKAYRKRLEEERLRTANQTLERGRSLYELSYLIGDIPDHCLPGAEGEQLCVWKTTRHTFGQGTLAASLGGDDAYRKKIRFECVLPMDGRARAQESCRAEVGG